MNCGYIEERGKKSVLCPRKVAQRYRVLAVAPTNPRLRAYMLVGLCRRHGAIKRPKR